jgi:hypothetical protein
MLSSSNNTRRVAGRETPCYARDMRMVAQRSSTHGAARRDRLVLALGVIVFLAGAPPAAFARHLKVWPLFDYTSDAATGTTSLKVLGPFAEFESDPQYRRIALRPLLSIRQARVGHDDEVRVLYPLMTSHWGPDEQTTRALGGLFTYRTSTTSDGKTLTGQHLRVLPLYFYDWDGEHGQRASLLPLYGNVENLAGYDRVQMVLFPGYLRLAQPRYDRRYWLFPFYSRVGGAGGSGYDVWPIYGRTAIDDTYRGGFVLWPFYVWDAYTRDGETERRFISFPFYSTVEGPRRASSAYGTILYVHTLDRAADVESFAFPWPLWEYERQTTTGAALTLRFLPFYETRHEGPLDTRIVAWPLYRERRFDDGVHAYRRTDGLLILAHDERETDLATGKTAHLRALFPAVVDEGDPTWDRGGTPALLDAMLPHDTAVRETYAPLWRAYGWSGPVEAPRVSILWGAVTRERGTTTYPWRWDSPDASVPAPE